ncbi:hypothetical protein KIN20_003518 [Parelaphostrongylus tenuis]|uniref:SCP domain-containing protein n=1 Tax=Parelaphostrongylus tenuis TaxID=148309 RepID=A0AAD5LZA2_PARTN|nr:hypothetical protein KIN20_003518 [Parelaphostrongylus tenuis]
MKFPAFGCNGWNINDRAREDVLGVVNDLRSEVALGYFKKQNMSSASNMNKLKWDCDLEKLAEQAIHDCPENPRSGDINYRL